MSVRLEAPRAVTELTRTLEDAGFETWAVGGAVRDALRGIRTGDWDLATKATPEEVRRTFRRTVPIGIDHGTVGVFGRDGVLYEVTTFRRDVIPLGRKAVVAFSDTIDEDLSRRDFTINAVAWHPLRGELRDPFGGQADLAAGRLRAVGDPAERFREDYLRVLRGLRFAGALGLDVEPDTWTGLVSAVSGVGGLSPERVRDELAKVMALPQASTALALYAEANVLPQVDATLRNPSSPADFQMVDHVSKRRPLLRFAAFFLAVLDEPVRSDARELLMRLRFSNADARRLSALLRAGARPPEATRGTAGERREWMSGIGRPFLRDAVRLWVASCRMGSGPEGMEERRALGAVRGDLAGAVPLTATELPVSGRDLLELGIPKGPAMGDQLHALLRAAWYRDDPPGREDLLQLVRDGSVEGRDVTN
ncbi:MAG: CCA tRNA nucleotidyltransferase [Gemmatimonadetes bacterium]|nr:CCA tRNA nucleotidyltransferase [Gemmatimonadota bacterium]